MTWCFVDPPYKAGLMAAALENLRKSGCLDENAVVVAETGRDKTDPPQYPGYQVLEVRAYGKTLVSILKHMV